MIKSRNFFATLDLNVLSSNSASSVTNPELWTASQFKFSSSFMTYLTWQTCYAKVLHGAKRLPAKALEACFQCSGSFVKMPMQYNAIFLPSPTKRRPKLLYIRCKSHLGLLDLWQKLPSGNSPLSGSSPTLMPCNAKVSSLLKLNKSALFQWFLMFQAIMGHACQGFVFTNQLRTLKTTQSQIAIAQNYSKLL